MSDPIELKELPKIDWVPDISLEAKDLLKILQHRYPMILIDRLYSNRKEKKALSIKNVTINEPFFQGHFPGNPIMPGVLILEAMAQSSVVMGILLAEKREEKNQAIYFASIDKARFRRPVVPGDRLEIEVQMVKKFRAIWKFRGKARVNGVVVAEADCSAAVVTLPD